MQGVLDHQHLNLLAPFSLVFWTFTFLILRSFSELSKGSVELFWATLSFILAPKKLLGSSLGAANGSLMAHNHSTDSMGRNFGALEDLLEALLVASRCPRDLHRLQIPCPELSRTDFGVISNSPQLNLSSDNQTPPRATLRVPKPPNN